MITVIDYGAGNLRSVTNALARLGYQAEITGDREKILSSPAVIFPGVGAAASTMKHLAEAGLDDVIRQRAAENKPLLAICVGLQVLFSTSDENGGLSCLDIIPGKVLRFDPKLKTPHMGWNQVNIKFSSPLLQGIDDGSDFYFVHSYYAQPADSSVIAGSTLYGVEFPSVIIRGNLTATQFHPEKSGETGLQLYANFVRLALKSEG